MLGRLWRFLRTSTPSRHWPPLLFPSHLALPLLPFFFFLRTVPFPLPLFSVEAAHFFVFPHDLVFLVALLSCQWQVPVFWPSVSEMRESCYLFSSELHPLLHNASPPTLVRGALRRSTRRPLSRRERFWDYPFEIRLSWVNRTSLPSPFRARR